jgi:hypothetical protein
VLFLILFFGFFGFFFLPESNSNDSGPSDPLYQLNQQHAMLRFGSNFLAMPASYESVFHNGPVDLPMAFESHRAPKLIERELMTLVKDRLEERDELETGRKRPRSLFEGDITTAPSLTGLSRSVVPTVYRDILDERRDFLPTQQTCGVFMNKTPYQPFNGTGVWRV